MPRWEGLRAVRLDPDRQASDQPSIVCLPSRLPVRFAI